MIEILEPIFQPEESELMAMPNLLHEPIPTTLIHSQNALYSSFIHPAITLYIWDQNQRRCYAMFKILK